MPVVFFISDIALLPSRRTADQPASPAARNKWRKLVRLRSGEPKTRARRVALDRGADTGEHV
jgi:hypothetical protein